MNLVLCGILTTAAILYCVIFDETLMFNMMMCVFTSLAIISLWTSENKTEQTENTDKTSNTSDIDDVTEQSTKKD